MESRPKTLSGRLSAFLPKGVSFITFTDGSSRQYENMMKGVPNFLQRSAGNYSPNQKYRFQDLDCRYCIEYKNCPPICLCPYILDNLHDLNGDKDFIEAIANAESCKNAQKLTLLYLSKGRLAGYAVQA